MTTMGQMTMEWDGVLTQNRLMSRDLTAEPQGMFDSVKEPLPLGVERYLSSLSEELHKAATWDTSIDITRFGDHRDTFAILGLRHLQSYRIGLPGPFFKRLLRYISFETYLVLRLSCRCWSEAITRERPISTPPVCRVPTEILSKIYTHLDPNDFNAARHTCRAWMITSVEERLLNLMLRRGGWSRAAEADLDLQEDCEGRALKGTNKEWLLSKRLATECSLRPHWTGIGQFPLSAEASTGGFAPLSITLSTDFSELSDGYNGYNPEGDCKHRPALHFTVSVCSKFLLVAEGCLVYIYSIEDRQTAVRLNNGYLSLLTTVVCPHRVLAVSMDTSSQRFAIAALLVGRMGFVCDISESTAKPRKRSIHRALPIASGDNHGHSPRSSGEENLHARTSFQITNDRPMACAIPEAILPDIHGARDHSPQSSGDNNLHDRTSFQIANDRAIARAIAEATLPDIHGAPDTRQSWTMNDPFLSPIEAPGSSQDYETPNDGMRLATGSRSIYRNLCSNEDPPRSVAICPQRRCVAFGCAAGIELHWIDALTGQDLNRWFPLTAPSDFLYFLPPRQGVDSAKKLRLISSAAQPKEREALRGRFFPSNSNDIISYQSMTWDEDFHGIGLSGSAWRGSGWCDHFQAVPVSDGWNMLFIDPEEGVLCMGSDAPPGTRAAKLSRRFIFAGPTDRHGKAIVPRVYASGRDLRWGHRIVAGYGEALWLFVVAPDLCFADEWSPAEKEHNLERANIDTTTTIEGVEIGQVPALIDVAVDSSGGDVVIWAFAADRMAYVWQIAAGRRPEQQWVARRDGVIVPSQDADGDAFMHNFFGPAVHFDGNAPMPSSAQDLSYDRIIDKDGDVAMQDGDEDEGYGSEFEAAGGTFAIHAPPFRGRWSEDDADWVPDYLGQAGSDIGHEGLGIDVLEMSRMDVEVLFG